MYATYVSYLPPDAFAYGLQRHEDPRGVFVELLRTLDSGQISYFTAPPGVTRGEHYHHTKTEKFLVVKGTARFGFRHVVTGETSSCSFPATPPGWSRPCRVGAQHHQRRGGGDGRAAVGQRSVRSPQARHRGAAVNP